MSDSDAEADQRTADAIVSHHTQLANDLNRHTERLLAAAEGGDQTAADLARKDLLGWLREDLLPHALAEERTLYPAAAARPEGALLIEGMVAEHRAIKELIAELDAASGSAVRAAATARALAALFAAHLAKENDLAVPLLVRSEDVSLAELLEGMHALLGHADHS